MSNPNRIATLALALCVSASTVCHAGPRYSELDKHQTPVPFPGVRGSHITYNLGPTGMRGWADWNHPRSNDTSPSREILIKSIEAGSPADGILRPYDIILGVADAPGKKPEPFTSDARLAIARAITMAESEAGNGELALLCWRDDGTGVVTLRLPVMGDYSDNLPPDCPKTRKIIAQTAEKVAAMIPAGGDDNLTGALNGLFLLASGDPRHLDPVRRTAHHLGSGPIGDGGHNTWRWGYVNLFLTEYFLATGDATVLPQIAEYCKLLVDGQCNPGTWGHRGVEGRIPPGYGSVNSAGLVAFLSLVTARECGVPFDHTALAHSIEFYGGYAGRGGLPYGDHPPTQGSADNGKNGKAAVAFHLLGADPAAQWFARLSASSNLAAFEGGHTGNFFNQLWTPLGASLSGETNFRNFRTAFHHYRDLARRWDGTFITQPQPNTREGDLGFGSYINKGPVWSTAAFGLSLMGGTGELAMLGRTRSVFSPGTPSALAPGLEHFPEKRFEECLEKARPLTASGDAEVAELAGQLVRAAERNLESIDHTLADMRQNLDLGDLFLLKQQLDAIESILDPADPRLAAFRAAVNDPAAADILKDGENYHSVISRYTMHGHRGFVYFSPGPQPGTDRRSSGVINQLASGRESHYQRQAAAWLAKSAPADAHHAVLVENLVAKTPVERQTFQLTNPRAVTALDLTWSLKTEGEMRVLLNGTTILHLQGPLTIGTTTIPLKPSTAALLKTGSNELTIQIDPKGKPFEATCKLGGWASK